MSLTFKVKLEGSDGGNWIATFEFLKQKLGICDLEKRVLELERPLKKQKILDFLKKEGKLRTLNYILRYFGEVDFSVWEELRREEKICCEIHGTRILYGVVEQ